MDEPCTNRMVPAGPDGSGAYFSNRNRRTSPFWVQCSSPRIAGEGVTALFMLGLRIFCWSQRAAEHFDAPVARHDYPLNCPQYQNVSREGLMPSSLIFAAIGLSVGALLLPGAAGAVEIKVLSTQATEQAYRELAPQFEKASGHTVTTIFTGTLDVQKRIAAGETYDLIIMAGPAIDDFIKSGKIVPGSRVDLAKSGVGVAVRTGAPKPDIGTTAAVKAALLAAKSIGYSTGPSGVYLTGLFQRLGVADAIKGKLKQTPTGVFVG